MLQRGVIQYKGFARGLDIPTCPHGSIAFSFVVRFTIDAGGLDLFPDPNDLKVHHLPSMHAMHLTPHAWAL